MEYSKLFVTYCTCYKACCKHNTQRVVNGVYLMLLNICEEESRFIIGRRNDRNEETMEQQRMNSKWKSRKGGKRCRNSEKSEESCG